MRHARLPPLTAQTRTTHRPRGRRACRWAGIGMPPLARSLIGDYLLAYQGGGGDVFEALADPTRRMILDELTVRARPARSISMCT